MPLYEYQCSKCKKRFEKIEKLSAPHKQKCPHCGGKAERLLSAPGIQFKGSGWYITDYSRAGGGAGKTEGAAATDSTADSKTKDAKETKETKDAKDHKPKKEKKK